MSEVSYLTKNGIRRIIESGKPQLQSFLIEINYILFWAQLDKTIKNFKLYKL